jgi:hypothetical protein
MQLKGVAACEDGGAAEGPKPAGMRKPSECAAPLPRLHAERMQSFDYMRTSLRSGGAVAPGRSSPVEDSATADEIGTTTAVAVIACAMRLPRPSAELCWQDFGRRSADPATINCCSPRPVFRRSAYPCSRCYCAPPLNRKVKCRKIHRKRIYSRS